MIGEALPRTKMPGSNPLSLSNKEGELIFLTLQCHRKLSLLNRAALDPIPYISHAMEVALAKQEKTPCHADNIVTTDTIMSV